MVDDDQRLNGALQENILTLLCFSDTFCKTIRFQVTPQLFESSMYREIAVHAIDFIDQFGVAIKEHLPDSLEAILQGEDKRKASIFEDLLKNLYHAKEVVQGEYVVTQLGKFVRQQNMKSAVMRAGEALEDGDVDAAELAMQKGLTSQMANFDGGISLGDRAQSLSFLDDDDQKPFLCGIKTMDDLGAGPARGNLGLYLAPMNSGKSWKLINDGKWAILQGVGVVHITLEMSAKKTIGRYHQAFFSISKHSRPVRAPKFISDAHGETTDVEYTELLRPSLADPDIRKYLSQQIDRNLKRRPRLLVKNFPTGSLTISMLKAYLDNLERFEKFTPGLLIIDYADLMAVKDPGNLRGELGEITKQLRGIAGERNMAVQTAAQTNREGIGATNVDVNHFSEDISKAFTADTIWTYNQTEQEYALGMARLYLAKHRDDEAKRWMLIAQSYAIGQYCLDSAPMHNRYWDFVKAGGRAVEP